MKRLLIATVAVFALVSLATPAPAAQGGMRGGPDSQGTSSEVSGNGRAGDAASHDNAHGTSEHAADRAGRNLGGKMNGVGNEDTSTGGGRGGGNGGGTER